MRLLHSRARDEGQSWAQIVRHWLPNWRWAALRIAERVLTGGEIVAQTRHHWVEGSIDSGAHVISRSTSSPLEVREPEVLVWGATGERRSVPDPYVSETRYTYRLRDVVVDPGTGVPWTPEGVVLGEVNQFGVDPRWTDVALEWSKKPRLKHSGKWMICAPNQSNYYHFLVEELPALLSSLSAVGGESVEIVGVCRDSRVHAWLRELQIPWTQIPRATVQCERYIVSGRRFQTPSSRDWELLKGLDVLKPTGVSPSRGAEKIFLSRLGYSRQIRWEGALIDRLRSQGWFIFDGAEWTLREQRQIFDGAKLVAGFAGAALANIVWMRPESRIVCLSPPDPSHGFLWDRLAALSGAEYSVCDVSAGDSLAGAWQTLQYAFG
jgi:hypothetical protein